MGRTEYRNVREEWDYEHLDARGNPRRIYVESSFDDSDEKKTSVSNKYGIFWKDGHYQRKVVKSTGQGRMVWEDTYEEDVEIRYEWLSAYDLGKILQKGEIIHVPVLSGEKKGSSVNVGYVCFKMKNDCGKFVKVGGIILDETFFYYDNNRDQLKGELIIPSKVSGLEVKKIRSFCVCEGITRLVLSEGIKSIEEKAFVGCKNIREIVFPKTINRIDSGAFEGCNAIKRLVIPEEVRYVRYGLSWYHSFKHVIGNLEEIARFEGDTQADYVLYLDNGSYLDFVCGKSINGHYTIPDGTKTIGTGAFAGCEGLTCITIPTSVELIGEKAFAYCHHLERVLIGDNSQLETIGDSAFDWCESLYHIDIPDTVSSIGSRAFINTSLSSIHLPEKLLYIRRECFCRCKKLKQINIPQGVKEIWEYAFMGCECLEKVTMPSIKVAADAFQGCLSLEEVRILPQNEYPKDRTPYADTPFGRNLEKIREIKKKEAEDRLRQEKEEEETKDNSNEESLNIVLMKEKWSEWLKKRKKTFIFLMIFFIGLPLFLIISKIVAGGGTEIIAGIGILIICVLFVALINIQMIIKMFNPAEFIVDVEGATLIIRRNGKERLSITSMKTKKILLVRQFGDIVQIGIYEKEPGFLSSGKGYRVPLAFIPQEQISDFVRLLQTFYGKERLLALTSVTSPLG